MSMKFGRLGLSALCAAACLAGAPARAEIVSTSGQLLIVTPPPSVVTGADQSNTTAIIFKESLTSVPVGGQAVDVVTPGTYHGGGAAPAPGTIPAGVDVESFLIHSDPLGTALREYRGSVLFSTAVLGIEILTDSVRGTDHVYGHPGTAYGTRNGGLESDDFVTLSADRRTVSFDFMTSSDRDEIRILTAVPEPSTLAMTALSTGAVLAAARRRRARPVA